MTALATVLAVGAALAALKAAGYVWILPPFSHKAWWRVSTALGVFAAVLFLWGKR